jgi:hypothetical protein
MTYFRFGTSSDGLRDLPRDSVSALRDLLATVRRIDEASGKGKSGELYFVGFGESAIQSAIELLWGREVWEKVSAVELTGAAADALDYDGTGELAEGQEVVQPDVAMMSLFRRPKPKLSKRDRDAVNLALGRKR